MIVGDPSTGYSFKATLAALNTLIDSSTSIGDLNGVVITSPTNGQALVYNGTNWVNQSISVPVTSVFGRTGAVVATEGDYSLDLLSDVTLTTPSSNQVLQYNGTAWVNATLIDNGITSLNGLTALSQTFATGSSGTDFAITSTTSTHTFNLPTASAVNRGALSSADWSTFNSKVGGSGTSGQVAYWTGTSSQSGSNNLFWDNANGRLGIGTNAPAVGLEVRNGANIYTSGAVANSHYLEFVSTSNINGYVNFRRAGNQNGDYAYQLINNVASFRANNGTGEVSLFATSGGYFLNFYSGGTEAMRIFSTTRNVLIQNGGTFTDGGQRLQVTGDVLFKGSGNTSGTTALTVQNSDGTNMWRILNNGRLLLGSDANAAFITPAGADGTGSISGLNTLFYTSVTTQNFGTGAFHFWGTTLTSTSGFNTQVSITRQFSPTSGTAQMYYLTISPTINQTGGANGITRGFYVNPTLTAAADWRSIQWDNNSGWGLYGAGTADNYLAGRLRIGTTGSSASLTVWNGDIFIKSDRFIGAGTAESSYNSVWNRIQLYNVSTGEMSITMHNASWWLRHNANMSIAGNLLLGSTTDGGQKLQVTGTSRFTSTLRFDENIRDNRDNSVIVQSASGVASNRDFTIGNGTYGRMMLTSRQVSFTSGTHPSLGAYGFYYNGETSTGAGNGVSIYFKAQTPTAANSNGGDFIIELPSGTGTGRQGSVIIGGTSPNASAILELSSSTKGFLPPKGTNAQMLAIASPVSGLVFYDTTNNKLNVYDGTNWVAVH
jgi:hypothetical protein